jgi:glutaredoxin
MSAAANRRALALGLMLCAAGAQAQLYKSVGPDGRVTYSDTPPAQAAAAARALDAQPAAGAAAPDLPYALAQAVKANPVTLYSAADCAPCSSGRALLAARGVPYSEKTVSSNEDLAALKAAGGDAQLPLLLIGRAKQQGYDESAWQEALSRAGYPAAGMLPRSWRNPAPVAAAPQAAAVQKPAQAAAPTPTPRAQIAEPPPAAGNAPPGFRF